MSLPDWIAGSLTLPAVCAPMFSVSTPALVAAACRSGVIGALPRHNLRQPADFDSALGEIHAACAADRAAGRLVGPLAVNLSTALDEAALAAELAICARHGVRLLISAAGHPGTLIRAAHDHGMVVWHDVTSRRFAEKAIEAGADGLIAIGAGGGGQSGAITPLALIPALRQHFGGTLVLAGGIACGAAIRAAEVLGADLAYLGTRFIATRESGAAPEYKAMVVSGDADSVVRTDRVTGVPASWLAESLADHGIDHASSAAPRILPPSAKPWKTVWSAGQGIALIDDVPAVADLVSRLRAEYAVAADRPRFG